MVCFRRYENAVSCWEQSATIDPEFPTVWRNLSLAYYNKCNNREKAVAALEKAFALDNTDARILMELDQLYKKLGRSYAERLTFLEKHVALVESRDDLALERITLYNQLDVIPKQKLCLRLVSSTRGKAVREK